MTMPHIQTFDLLIVAPTYHFVPGTLQPDKSHLQIFELVLMQELVQELVQELERVQELVPMPAPELVQVGSLLLLPFFVDC